LHVGAGTSAKRWPAESWHRLAEQLVARDARIVLVGTRPDAQAAEVIASSCKGGLAGGRCLNLVGSLSVAKLAAVLRRAELFIGADSGPSHVAAAVGTPVLALFSGTNDPQQWKPCGERVAVLRAPPACSPCHRETCVWADHPCMRGITVETVLHAAADTLRRVGYALQMHVEDQGPDEPMLAVAGKMGAAGRNGWARPTLRCWLLAAWMVVVAAAYLWHMLGDPTR
jgi:ADP-heptose:LPS heptosyltransferase